ncbi:MAG: hypothetical protein L0Z62_16035 [Gemmataceae bacterium]|nr:hypothetical protein [Gemmataceae bacterium]
MRSNRCCLAGLVLAALLALTVGGGSGGSARQPAGGKKPRAEERDRPHDLILVVDVSLSMIDQWQDEGKRFPPSDPEGIRWDGIQFTIDVARDTDRIALVLYRAENVVLTRFIEEPGLIQLAKRYPNFGGKTGRELLTALVKELQDLEKKWGTQAAAKRKKGEQLQESDFRDFTFELLRGQGGKPGPIPLAHGTASVLALQTVREQLLAEAGQGGKARAWTLLFTDGRETAASRSATLGRFKLSDYDYIKARGNRRGSALEAWVKQQGWVEPFRKAGVPIITFALGGSCDSELLRSLALLSTPERRTSHGASYEPKDNLQLLEDLQHIQWELREHWRREVKSEQNAGVEIFRVPGVGVADDLGVLVYSRPTRGGGRGAIAPRAAPNLSPTLGTRDLPDLRPRESQSHWYYALGRDELARQAPPKGAHLRLSFARQDGYATHGVAALQAAVKFTYRGPAEGEKVRYTPRDVIPFQVDFTPTPPPGGASPFRPEHFAVEVILTPAGTSQGRGVEKRIPLEQLVAHDGTAQFRNVDTVLDDAPDSRGNSPFVGPCYVDVVITGKPGSPLDGFVRRLLRRTLVIGDYPTLELPDSIRLTNASAESARVAVPLTLKQPAAPDRLLTPVTVALDDGEVPRGMLRVPVGTSTLKGKGGTLSLELPADRWASLKVDVYRATLSVKLPWQKEAQKVRVIVEKAPYKLTASPGQFRLDMASRGKSAPSMREIKVEVELQTTLETAEKVWLSATPDQAAQPAQVFFEQVEDPNGQPLAKGAKGAAPIPFQVEKLGVKFARSVLGVKGRPRAVLSLQLTPRSELPAGGFRHVFYLVGPGSEPTPVPVKVVTNAISLKDPRSRPLDQLVLLGLAGARARQTVTFSANREEATVKEVRVKKGYPPLKNVSLNGWDRLPLAAMPVPGRPDEVALDLGAIPWCVQQGKYETEVAFEVDYQDRGGKRSVEIALPVSLEVLHKVIRFRQGERELHDGLLVKFKDRCSDFADTDIELTSDAKEVPVRWRVNRVEAKGGSGKPLPPGLLDVRLGTSSVLDRPGPSEPFTAGKPVKLTVRALRKGLEPGLYRVALEFLAFEHDPNQPTDKAEKGGIRTPLEVLVLVPGRALKEAKSDSSPFLGEPTTARVTVTCYDCEPDAGKLQPLDGLGKPVGVPVEIRGPAADGKVPDVKDYTFVVEVKPARAGKNSYRVTWPALCPGDPIPEQILTVQARGVIEASPRVAYAEEEILLRAKIDPAGKPADGRLRLRVVDLADPEAVVDEPLLLPESSAAQDGTYSVRYRFPRVGEYRVSYAEGGAPGVLKHQDVRVDFDFRAPAQLGMLQYGSAGWLDFLGIREELSDPAAFLLVNKRPERLRWKARLRFPRGGSEGKQLTEGNVDTVPSDPRADPRVHLDARLIVESAGKGTDPGWAAGGILQADQEQALGVEVKLSKPALDEVYGNAPAGAAPHPTLGRSNALILEMALEWLDANDEVVARRSLRVPFSVGTRHWTGNVTLWLIGGAVLVGLFVVVRMVLRRLRKPAKGPPPATGEMSVTAPAPAAAPASPPPPRPTAPPRTYPLPRGGDEDVPEHMR